ncbi:thrombospondin-related anonymous protein, putative [Babesia ovata]|uniref:Thrombospondin-related anonymous protein, putative n=1 Tax=Babesia ovata TaxID=189622 RepID=A0A2H6KF88_9APIC|nr:thrombospondin-related anonymous protein, putative [Babesia ovata]GBE61660.1 thrombospondin-related anonymous protein, putative [Babesia ovata]
MKGCFQLLFLAPLVQFVLYYVAVAPTAAVSLFRNELPKHCKRQLDFSIVVDESASISKKDWMDRMIPFLENLIETIDLDGSDIRLSLTTYSTPTRSIITFLDKEASNTKMALEKLHQMRDSKPAHGMTYTGHALSFVRKAILPYGRKNAPKALLLVTDGASSDPDLTAQEAAMIRDEGVNVLVIGVGNVKVEECRGIVGCDGVMDCPMFKHTNWKDMIHMFYGLMKEVCDTLPQDATCSPVWTDWSECNAPCNVTGTRTRQLKMLETITQQTAGSNGQQGRTCKEQEIDTPAQTENCIGKCVVVPSPRHDIPAPFISGRTADGSTDHMYSDSEDSGSTVSGKREETASEDINDEWSGQQQNNSDASVTTPMPVSQNEVDPDTIEAETEPEYPKETNPGSSGATSEAQGLDTHSGNIGLVAKSTSQGDGTTTGGSAYVRDHDSHYVKLRGDMDPEANDTDSESAPVAVPQSPSQPELDTQSSGTDVVSTNVEDSTSGGSTVNQDYGSHHSNTTGQTDSTTNNNDLESSTVTAPEPLSEDEVVPGTSDTTTPNEETELSTESGAAGTEFTSTDQASGAATGGSTVDHDYGSHYFKVKREMDPATGNTDFSTASDLGEAESTHKKESKSTNGSSWEHSNETTSTTTQNTFGTEGWNHTSTTHETTEETDLATQAAIRRQLEKEREEDLRRELEVQHKKELEAEERLKQQLSVNQGAAAAEQPTSTSGEAVATGGDDHQLGGFHILGDNDSASQEFSAPVKADVEDETEEATTEESSSRSSSNTTKIAGGALLGLLLLGAGGGYAMYKKFRRNKAPGFDTDAGDFTGGDEGAQPMRDAETYTVTEFDNNIWGEAT